MAKAYWSATPAARTLLFAISVPTRIHPWLEVEFEMGSFRVHCMVSDLILFLESPGVR